VYSPYVRWRDGVKKGRSWCVEGEEGLLHRNVQRFRGGLVFKAHRLLYHSTLALRVITKKKRGGTACNPRIRGGAGRPPCRSLLSSSPLSAPTAGLRVWG